MADDAPLRRRLDVVFGLMLASGVSVEAVGLWGIADWVKPQGEGAFGMYILGVLSFIPTVLAWLASGLQTFMAPRDRHARLGAGWASGHLAWWLAVVSLGTWLDEPMTIRMTRFVFLEPVVFGFGATYLGVRWFWSRRQGTN